MKFIPFPKMEMTYLESWALTSICPGCKKNFAIMMPDFPLRGRTLQQIQGVCEDRTDTKKLSKIKQNRSLAGPGVVSILKKNSVDYRCVSIYGRNLAKQISAEPAGMSKQLKSYKHKS